MKKRGFNLRKWCDEWILAGRGIILATREKKFWIGFGVSFLFFGTLMNLLAGGTGKFQLMWAVGFPKCLEILGSAIIGVIGVNVPFLEWVPVAMLAVLQGILIGLIVLLWEKKRNGQAADNQTDNAENVQKAGIVAGLIALGAGCPTCGTTLLAPLFGTIFSSGGMAVTGAVSGIVTVLAVVIALLSLKRIGEETYVIMINEKYLLKKRERQENNKGV